MAYDSQLRKLWAEPTDGIQLWQIYSCLGYNKVDQNGNRNLGMVITNSAINKWAKHKPFRFNQWNFASDADRDAARKEMHQGLNIPTAANAGITSTMGKTYLGELAYRALSVAGTPNWEYLRPRGVTDVYNEPFRTLDFDDYNHLAEQPFDTKGSINNSGTMTLLPPAANMEIKVNRFVTTGLRFTLLMNNTNVDISMADLLYGSDADFYFLVAEKYVDSNVSGKDYYQRDPDEVLKAPTSIAEIPQHGGASIIDYALEANNDNKQIKFVVGVNEYTSNAADAKLQTRGYGFIAPYGGSSHFPFLYTIKQEYYGVLAYKQIEGYYYKAGPTLATFNLHDYNRGYEKNYSDIVGLSLNIKQTGVNFYITGSNPQSIPSGAKAFQFRLQFPTLQRYVVGIVSNNDMSTGSVTSTQLIHMGSDWETVYLKFPRFILKGERIDSAILEVSADGGATWTTIDQSASAELHGFEFATDCDGSSVKLLLEGTVE
jgi:hypothetical protein